MAKFCANLAFLFTEKTLLDRYELAKIAGFKAVETGFPFGYTKQEVVNAKQSSGLEQVLINIYTGKEGKIIKGNLLILFLRRCWKRRTRFCCCTWERERVQRECNKNH